MLEADAEGGRTLLKLRLRTGPDWVGVVLGDFDAFLRDHAGCERKAAATAMSLVGAHPDKVDLVGAMLDLAVEELDHLRRVWKVLAARGARLAPDVKDPYVAELRTRLGRGRAGRLLDRLLISAVIEARSCERLGLVAAALEAGPVRDLYRDLARCEARHGGVFVGLAERYHGQDLVRGRLGDLLDFEADVVARLPLRAAVH